MEAYYSCPRGHVFRAHSSESEMPCPSAIAYDAITGETRYCPEIAERQTPRVDVLALHTEVLEEMTCGV